MKRISALEQKIRNYVNIAKLCEIHFQNRPDDWNALCVAMDTLGDTCLALEYYEASGIGNKDGEKYLKLYGLLQAIFLQQDSIHQLYRTFMGKKLQRDSDSTWWKIRDLRNLTVGHPIEKKDKFGTKRCFITRTSMHSGGFWLMVWNKDKGQDEFENINLKSEYESYKLEAIEYLESVHQAQVMKWGPLANE